MLHAEITEVDKTHASYRHKGHKHTGSALLPFSRNTFEVERRLTKFWSDATSLQLWVTFHVRKQISSVQLQPNTNSFGRMNSFNPMTLEDSWLT